MVKYILEVGDNPEPGSRLEFLKRLETSLKELKDEGIIGSYVLRTPSNSKLIIFKVEEETK